MTDIMIDVNQTGSAFENGVDEAAEAARRAYEQGCSDGKKGLV
jgi:hypothetical protein